MQRLTDIVDQDLSFIMNEFRDFTTETVIQCGDMSKTLSASLQIADIEFTADITPINAFRADLYFINPGDSDFDRRLVKNAIIYVDNKPFKIIDKATTFNLVVLSLESKQGR